MADKSKLRWLRFVPRVLGWLFPSLRAASCASGRVIGGIADAQESSWRAAEARGTAAGRAAKASSDAASRK